MIFVHEPPLTEPRVCPSCDGHGDHIIQHPAWGGRNADWDWDEVPCDLCGGSGVA